VTDVPAPVPIGERWTNSVRVLATCARLAALELRSTWIVIAVVVLQPVAFLTVALLPSADRSPSHVTRVVIGVALSVSWSATAWGAASILRRERAMGTLARALAGLVDARLIVLGKGLGSAAASTAGGLAMVVAVTAVTRWPVSLSRPDALILGLLVLFVSGSAVGLLVGSVFVLTRYGAQISGLLTYPVLVLAGLLIPLSAIPEPIRSVSAVISLRWLQEFLTSSAAGDPHWTALGWACLLTMTYGVGGWLLFGRVARKARRDGTISLY
jgi:ABC-2 type transport system permease protein